ncbi:unnamed protein product (macronuclear) [Paramecium tetraurelia]|uniref:Uncharacterized protein n=1 Tax=Paramecium tetraurelia TaxID=5888 RepID=A0E3B7_PARTE|nr:uncharacterized protein GSPATT00022957001 [Paramecium tetraurelia]CAK89784.1 unnamed protein product [Paramecium tetraurelia]|eukprot:XP_001457181.1 hypothetical protein (macronuclear) [Paramecium tetraurelia strain d4-2]
MDDQNKLESLRTAIISGMIDFINKNQQENEEEDNIQDTQQNLQIIHAQVQTQLQINFSSPQNLIIILNKELIKLKGNKALTKHQKKFYKANYSQQLLENLSQTGQAKTPISLPSYVNPIIDNVDVLFYALKECLLRAQNRELLKTDSSVSAGLESLVGAFGQDQGCLKFRTIQVDYNKLTTDDYFRNQIYLNQNKKQLNITILRLIKFRSLQSIKGVLRFIKNNIKQSRY